MAASAALKKLGPRLLLPLPRASVAPASGPPRLPSAMSTLAPQPGTLRHVTPAGPRPDRALSFFRGVQLRHQPNETASHSSRQSLCAISPRPGSNRSLLTGWRVHAAQAVELEEGTVKGEKKKEKALQLKDREGGSEEGMKDGKRKKWRKVKFVKYQGLGNDFILIENRKQTEPIISTEEAIQLCDRNFGIGADGVIFLLPPDNNGAEFGMRIYNSDGSEPEMCGNGIRCLARFIMYQDDHDGPQRYVVSTLAGNMVLNLKEDGQVQVDMGEPILKAPDIPTTLFPSVEGAVVNVPLDVAGVTWNVTCVSMGNPHCIVYSSSEHPNGFDVSALDLQAIGPQFEKHPAFPARINTEFVQVISRNELKMRVWERGAGPTLACGTGACALVVAGVLEGRAERKCLVHLPGGPLEIEWSAEDNRVYMTGPAKGVFEGKIYLPPQE